MKKIFIYALLDGEVTPEQISDYVEDWHRSSSPGSLHEYLGLTDNEYSRWVRDPNELLKIVEERRANGRKPKDS